MSEYTAIGTRTRILNQALSVFILIVLVISPLMIGSNRPVFWLINSTVVMSVTAVVLLLATFGVMRIRVSVSRWRLIIALAVIYLLGITVQMGLSGLFPNSGMHSQSTVLIGLMRVISYACLFFLILQVSTNVKRARRLAWGVFGVVVLMAIYSLVSQQAPDLLFYEKAEGVKVVTGPFINRNSLATYLAFGCALGTALVLRGDREGKMRNKRGRMDVEMVAGRIALFVAVLLMFATILTTGSRMGTFVGFLGIFVPVILRVSQAEKASGSRQALVGLSIAVVVVLAFVIVSALYGGVVFDRLGSTGLASDVRWPLYENIWNVVLQRPFTGHGFDSFELAFRSGHELPVSPDLRWQNAHNTYLELWVELGLILGSIPPLICVVILLRLIKRGATNQYTGYLAQAAVAAIVIAAVHSFVDFSLEIEANVFLFIVVLGLGLAPDDSKIK
ncbi:MAG: O-antigen ligase family protein [Paracoccaceae bacterium]|nr:O-antigen ligase family protein [Paracoccaceae bacterium]MDG2257007.1 O-antigen ligase family protein [Paracoccaceae bacterium]